jgi:hypothetical protein
MDMYPNQRNRPTENLIREIQELEDAYAEALGDEADASTLSSLWQRIKMLNSEIAQTERPDRYYTERERHR